MQIRSYQAADEVAVVALWDECRLIRQWNDPRKDIARKLAVQPELLLVGVVDGAVVASVMAGYEGHRGWVNYLAVAPAFRGRGFARTLMQRVEELLLERGCPKVNLQVRESNREAIDFYRHLGYALDESVSLGKRLIEDRPV
ncbi:MAG TPA: GNAT family acetyltransferase [Burkholderiales bacterium]|nr:GNAT family acetyltransferase [Burkholderiales bacterium]